MMDRVDRSIHTVYLSKYTICYDLSDIRILISTSRLIVMITPSDVLYERTSVGDIEELHPLADTEDRLLRTTYSIHRIEEPAVSLQLTVTGSSPLLTIEYRVDIRSPRKNKTITATEKILELRRTTRDDHRNSTSRLDRSYIVECEIVVASSVVVSLLCEYADDRSHRADRERTIDIFV
jgi:hypothetical protein